MITTKLSSATSPTAAEAPTAAVCFSDVVISPLEAFTRAQHVNRWYLPCATAVAVGRSFRFPMS